MKRVILGLLVAGALAGCKTTSFLDQRTESDRADYGDKVIPILPPSPPPPHVNVVNPDPVQAGIGALPGETVVTGTWTFTTPPTVTRLHRQTGEIDQYSLYNGRPGPTDTPFVVITVSRDRRSVAESEPGTYKVANHREYALNGQAAHEWTGNTNTGAGFCELIVNKLGDTSGDVCHVMAIAKNAEEQKLALDILASIVWKASQ